MAFTAPEEDLSAPAPAAGGFVAPQEDVQAHIQKLKGDSTFDPVAHAAMNPEDADTAFQVDQARANRTIGEKAGAAAKTVFSLAPWVEGVKGVGKFLGGLVQTPIDVNRQAYDSLIAGGANAMGNTEAADAYGRKAAQLKAENILAAQGIEQNLRNLGRKVVNALPSGGEGGVESMASQDTLAAMTPEERKAHETQQARADFNARIQAFKNQQQIATGTPIDTGVVSAITPNEGAPLSETYGPEGLKSIGAPPVRPLATEMKTAAGDPLNLALAEAPMLPGARAIGGAATELAGKGMQLPLKAAQAIPGHLGSVAKGAIGLGAGYEAYQHPEEAAGIGALLLGAKLGSKLGRVFEAQGNEFRTGNPSAYTQAAEAAENAGKSTFVPNTARNVGNLAATGISTAAGFAPVNAIQAESPEEFAQSTIGAGIFGAGLGALHASASLRAMDQALQAKLMEQHGQTQFTANPDYAAHNATMAKFAPEDQARINRLRSFLFGGTDTDVLVVDGPTFAKAAGGEIGQGARGKITPDGSTIYLNADALSAAGGKAGQATADTAGHETGHAVVKWLSDMSQQADSRGLIQSIAQRLSPQEIGDMTNAYYDALVNSTKGVNDQNRAAIRAQIEKANPVNAILEENLAEITRSILRGEDVSKFTLSKPLKEKIIDGAARMFEALGLSAPVDPDATLAFKTRMVKEAARRMQDTLYDVGEAARKARVAGPTTEQAIRDLQNQLSALDKPKPTTNAAEAQAIAEKRDGLQKRLDAWQKVIAGEQQPPQPVPQGQNANPTGLNRFRIAALLRQQGIGADEAKQWADVAEGKTDEEALIDALKKRANQKFPSAPAEPVQIPLGEKGQFTDETGQKHTVTGGTGAAPRIGDIVATRDGEIRRVTRAVGDTIDTTRTTDPMNARGTKTHKIGDVVALAHDYAPDQPTDAKPETPALSVKPGPAGTFIIVDAAGNPTSQKTYNSERDAQSAIAKTGKKSTFGIPPSPNGDDIIDAIMEEGGINLSTMLKEERENQFQHKGIWRNTIDTDNPNLTPDEVARLVHDKGFGDGTPGKMFLEISKAIQGRNQFRDQQAAEEKRQRQEERANVQPAGKTPETQNQPLPQSPAVAIQALPTPVQAPSGPGPLRPALPTREAVDAIVANAEQKAVAAEKKPETDAAQKRIYNAKANAILDAIGDDHSGGLHREVDPVGNVRVVGNFDIKNPYHAALVDLAGGITQRADSNLQQLQGSLGDLMHIRYRSAKSQTEDTPWQRVGMTERRGEYVEDPAADRTKGTIQHKAIIPITTVFKGGRPMEQVFTLDNLLHNAESYNNFVKTKGLNLPLAEESTMIRDAKVYADNHAHGWKGDGSAPIKGFPDSNLPKPDLNYTPETIPADRFAVMNLLMHSEDAGKYAQRIKEVQEKQDKLAEAKTEKDKARLQGVLNRAVERMKTSEEAYALAQENNPWVDEATGESNPIRAKLKAEGFDTNDAFKSPFETLDPQHILEGAESAIPMQEGDIQTVRPTGFTAPASDLEPMSKLNPKAVAAGFMPESREGPMIDESDPAWIQRFESLSQKEQKGKLTPEEEDEIDALHQRVNKEYGSLNAYQQQRDAEGKTDVNEPLRESLRAALKLQPSGFMPTEDTGKPEDGGTPGERLAREAEEAGVVLKIDQLKGLIAEDKAVMDQVRARIQQNTGKPATFMPLEDDIDAAETINKLGERRIRPEALGLPYEDKKPPEAPDETIKTTIPVSSLKIGRDELIKSRLLAANRLFQREPFKDKGVSEIHVVPSVEPGKYVVSANGNHRAAILMLTHPNSRITVSLTKTAAR